MDSQATGRKASLDRYNNSEKGRAARKKYEASAKGKAAQKRRREKEATRIYQREYQRAYREQHPAETTISVVKWQQSNLEKVKCRQMVRLAIRLGFLVRQPCEVCGEIKSDAHHEDYAKPLEVRWLCRYHHKQAHAPI